MRKRKLVVYLVLLSLIFGVFTPFKSTAAGYADNEVLELDTDTVDPDDSVSGTLTSLSGGKYQVDLQGTTAGATYTLIVLAGEYDSFPASFIDDLLESVLYIDMKKATGENTSFTFIPRKQGLSSVFVTCGKLATDETDFDVNDPEKPSGTGIVSTKPIFVGKIAGEAVQEDEVETCTISFAPGTGSGAMSEVKVERGELYTLPQCGFIPSNAIEVFDRWDAGSAGDVIKVYEDMTLTALWKDYESSVPDDDEEEVETGDGTGLKAEFVNPKAIYVYTGSPITPEVTVTYDGKKLLADEDYVLSYKNNINASGKEKAYVVINGKDSFTGTYSLEFKIEAKDIKKGDTRGNTLPVVAPDTVYMIKGSKKGSITVTYGNYTLKPGFKDYSFTAPYGGFNYDGPSAINSYGNFKGSREVQVKVVDRKELKKHEISVKMDKETPVYNGQPQTPSTLKVYDPDGNDITDQEGSAYIIHYVSDNTDAGNVKFTVQGIYPYAGSTAKSFTISPISTGVTTDISDTAVYKKTGAVPDKISVTYSGKELVQGKDYKIKFSSNKKVGKGKYTITFIGNYKKTKKKTGTFMIEPANISDARVVVPDVVYGKKSGPYPSTPYVEAGGELLKKNDYTVIYYDADGNVIDKKNPVDLTDKDYADVTVRITGKGNYTGPVPATYRIWKQSDNLIDLTKARIVSEDEKPISKQYYTGFEIRPGFICQIKNGSTWENVNKNKYKAYWVGNIKKGTAYIVIKPVDGSGLIGSKAVKFSIAVKKW